MKKLIVALAVLFSSSAMAGTWGQENWGQMYWGENPATAPIVAPAYTVKVDDDRFIVEFTNYAEGSGEDGWSAITGYVVQCTGTDSQSATVSPVIVEGLSEDAEYNCTVTASNAFGDGPSVTFTARTDALIGGLPIWLLKAASDVANQNPQN
jgi:hypothetical protein